MRNRDLFSWKRFIRPLLNLAVLLSLNGILDLHVPKVSSTSEGTRFRQMKETIGYRRSVGLYLVKSSDQLTFLIKCQLTILYDE